MAVQLFLDEKEVIIDDAQEIRITKENPYFTLSDSYTLDVAIPLDIVQNRNVFGSIQRKNVSKSYREFTSRLMCNNSVIMEGTAHIVQSTEQQVKVQIASGVSALKMSSEQEGLYIDRIVNEKEGYNLLVHSFGSYNSIDYGNIVGDNHLGYGVIMLDSTNDAVVNLGASDILIGRGFPYISDCPRLIDIASLVASKIGYTLDLSYLPEACRCIYIVTSVQGNLKKKLPHWTVKEFFTEFQNFFGCTFTKTGNKSLKLVPISAFANNPTIEIEPIEEFQVDYSEDDEADGVMNKNIEFDMDSGGLDVIDDEILEQAQSKVIYPNVGAMANAFLSDDQETKMHKIYMVNGEMYVGWQTGENNYELRRIAPFNPLKRYTDADSVKLKISPALIEEDVECSIEYVYDFWGGGMETLKFSVHMPSVENPFGLSNFFSPSTDENETPTLQELVEGTKSIIDESDKSDKMRVVFVDGKEETIEAVNESGSRTVTFPIHLSFTDYGYKKQLTNNRKKWSFSLNDLSGYEFYLGQLHKKSFFCSHKVKHMFRFLSDSIPDPTSIFVVQGKHFACEKIEASIKDGELERLMTGYFWELFES